MKNLMLLCACFFLSGMACFAQLNANNQSTERLYFEFPTLDFNKYAELHETVKADGNFLIETACIPARVICVKKLSANSSTEAFKQLASLSALTAVEWQGGQVTNAFDQRCLDARSGN